MILVPVQHASYFRIHHSSPKAIDLESFHRHLRIESKLEDFQHRFHTYERRILSTMACCHLSEMNNNRKTHI